MSKNWETPVSRRFLVEVPYKETVYGTVSYIIEAETAEEAIQKYLDTEDMGIHDMTQDHSEHFEMFHEEAEAEQITNENYSSV